MIEKYAISILIMAAVSAVNAQTITHPIDDSVMIGNPPEGTVSIPVSPCTFACPPPGEGGGGDTIIHLIPGSGPVQGAPGGTKGFSPRPVIWGTF